MAAPRRAGGSFQLNASYVRRTSEEVCTPSEIDFKWSHAQYIRAERARDMQIAFNERGINSWMDAIIEDIKHMNIKSDVQSKAVKKKELESKMKGLKKFPVNPA